MSDGRHVLSATVACLCVIVSSDILTSVDQSVIIDQSTNANVSGDRCHVTSAARPERGEHRRSRRVLHEAVRHRARQTTPRLCQLRDRRPAPEARADRRQRRARESQPPRCRGRIDRRRHGHHNAPDRGSGLACATEDEVACCYTIQDKVWVDGPAGEPWEIYTVLADVEMPGGQLRTVDPTTGASCCAVLDDESVTAGPTCC